MVNVSRQFIGLPFLHTLCHMATHKALFLAALTALYHEYSAVQVTEGDSGSRNPPLRLSLHTKVTALLKTEHCNSFSTVFLPSGSLGHRCR